MIDAPASKSFTAPCAIPQKDRMSPLVWMNAVCLDAPIVAVSWLGLFARSFDVPVARAGMAALFLTAWLIYLADRLADTATVNSSRATAYRLRFCLAHRRGWIAMIIVVALADAAVVATQLPGTVLAVGAAVALLAIGYLLTNQLRPEAWRLLPAKEIAIGVLFAAGSMVPMAAHWRPAATLPWALFAALCSLNCICIAVWERWLDVAQQRISIATAFPRVGGMVLPLLMLLAGGSFAAGRTSGAAQVVYVCIGSSAALLAVTHLLRRRIQPDVRTALADLVLLTPMLALVTWR